jgi:Mannosylglycerate hydrolase MGH1-like glycoside hydrolase domain
MKGICVGRSENRELFHSRPLTLLSQLSSTLLRRSSIGSMSLPGSRPDFHVGIFLTLVLITVAAVHAAAPSRDFCAELQDILSFECQPGLICTRGFTDLESHFSIVDQSDWTGLGPENYQLHFNRYPLTGSSRLLNLLAFDVKSERLYFRGGSDTLKGRRQLFSYPNGTIESVQDGDLRGVSKTLFVGLDTVLIVFRYKNLGTTHRTIRPLLVGQLGDLPPPPTHSKPGGSKPGPNPLPPFPAGELGQGTNAWFDEKVSTLMVHRYIDLPRADTGRIAVAVKAPAGWNARIGSEPDEETAAARGAFAPSRGQQAHGLPVFFNLVGKDETLAPQQEVGFAVVIAFGLLHHFGVNYLDQLQARANGFEAARQFPEKSWEESKKRWNTYFSSLPKPHVSVRGGEQLYLMSYYTLKRNLYAPDWNFHSVALFETKGWYDAVWQWSIAPFGQLALLQLDPKLAQQQSYFFTENALPTGMIPEHVFNTFTPTDTIHPQLLAYGAWLVYQQTRDRGYLERIYDPIARHFDWLYAGGMDTAGNVRDKDRDGIFEWGSPPWDNGLDNDPRSDIGLEKLEAVDLNAYVLLSAKCLVRMAEELGRANEAGRWRERAHLLEGKIIEHFYDPEANMFWDRHYDTGEPFKVLGFHNFLPLLAGVPLEKDRIKLMIRSYLLSPKHFWGKLPFPSLAFSDARYSATNYMRGPVWPGPSFLLITILWKNGFHLEADLAATRFLELVARWKTVFENYNSETGEPLYGKRVEMISWNAACVVDLFLQLYRVDDGLM